jgi:TonB family protein
MVLDPKAMIRLVTASALLLSGSLLGAQTDVANPAKKTQQVCQLISANPPDFDPFAFVPTVVKDKRFKNRYPKISFGVGEDGSVINVRVVKGTGSPAVDAALVKSVQAWKYKPQPGCAFSMSSMVTIDVE